MNSSPWTKRLLVLACVIACGFVRAANLPDPAKEDFSNVSTALVDMLESGHLVSFAESLAPSMEDWRAALPTNQTATVVDVKSTEWRQTLASQRQKLALSARLLSNRAVALKIDLSKVKLSSKVLPPQKITEAHFPVLPDKESLLAAESVDVVLTAEPLPDADGAEALRGDYVVRVTQLLKFPGGWRCAGGVQWIALPKTVADEQTQRDMAIESKANATGALNSEDDPALAQLGVALVKFLRARDVKVFESDVMLTFEGMKSLMQKLATAGRKLPPDAEIQTEWERLGKEYSASAKVLVDLMETERLDFKDAEITVKGVGLKSAMARFASGSLEGMNGNGLRLEFTVKSKNVSKTGKPLSGDYALAAQQTVRVGGRWYVLGGLSLEAFPAGVIDERALAELRRKSAEEEMGYLPVGTEVPEIEFVRLSDEQRMKLSELRGKVVVLDFWATWCGPCQEPMAHMQKYREENPAWRSRVAVVALSIDDSIKIVRNHMERRGWTNTFNTWVGEGAWESAPTKAFRVHGVPTCYVIDAQGKVVQAGHPGMMDVPDLVNRTLK
ncbi:MAG: hypothetical protein RLY20_855 [Verrucomicrobiota bacterium]